MLRIWINNNPLKFWLLSSLLLFILPLGSGHLFDWDEINFAENAREMVLSKNFLAVQLNFEPFFEKPPLFIWLQALSFSFLKTFQDIPLTSMEFAARLPNAIIGSISILSLYSIGKKIYNQNFGHWWAFAYLVSLAPHIYASSGIIDPTFNLFIFLAIFFTWKSIQSKPFLNSIIASIFLGFAMLTKGPVALLIWGLTCLFYLIFRKSSIPNLPKALINGIVIIILSSLIFLSWYFALSLEYGWGIFSEFIQYQIRLLTTGDAGHGQPFYYHFIILLLVVFPISGFAFPELFRFKKIKSLQTYPEPDFEALMRILFWTVLILFSLVKTKIIHYSSMCWIPMTFIGAKILYDYQNHGWRFSIKDRIILGIIGNCIGIIFLLVPYIGRNSFEIIPFIQDKFAQGNLQAPVEWPILTYGIGALLLIFTNYWVWIKINRGVQGLINYFVVFIGITVFTSISLLPRVEGYTQRTLIDFCEAKAFQDVYVETIGFKSYAHYLYFEKQKKSIDAESLLNAKKLDKPAFFIMKNTVEDKYRYHPNLIFIKEENGFLFYKKK
ncbi:MAG: Lipid 4-amino-4-deoxy-L-arabinosyltransferase [Bacteroidota bacterium]|jgi:4-amino-4-deoxy-L-arabinose transferase-like glycosyltransferase